MVSDQRPILTRPVPVVRQRADPVEIFVLLIVWFSPVVLSRREVLGIVGFVCHGGTLVQPEAIGEAGGFEARWKDSLRSISIRSFPSLNAIIRVQGMAMGRLRERLCCGRTMSN